MKSEEEEDYKPAAWFLGPKLENVDILKKLVEESFNVSAEFRQHHFPSDPQSITTKMKESRLYKTQIEHLTNEFRTLCRELKYSTNLASIRYQGLLVGDMTLPSIVGYIAALIYNTNTVSNASSQATTPMEIEVGLQLCDMMGYNLQNYPAPWGHLTEGGTSANIEGMWSSQNVRFYPLAVQQAIKESPNISKDISNYQIYIPATNSLQAIPEVSLWNLVNVDIDEAVRLSTYIQKQPDGEKYLNLIEKFTVRYLGWSKFMKRHNLNKEPVVLCPASSHYSFLKAVSMIGLGEENLINIEIDANTCMNITEQQIPVISLISVHGSTEFGTLDPLEDIIGLKEKFRKLGLNFTIHVDAAFGGYFACILKDDSENHHQHGYSRSDENENESVFSEYIIRQHKSLKYADTVTIDPHKSGFVPYPAGALCYRNGLMRNFIKIGIPLLHSDGAAPSIGMYGIAGSAPGASAASVLLSHRVIGLHKYGYGQILERCALGAKLLYCKWLTLAKDDDNFVCVPLHPLPPGISLDCAKSFILRNISGKALPDIKKNKQTMSFLRGIGSNTSINCFALNLKNGQQVNPDVDICSKLNSEMYLRLSSFDNRRTCKRIPLLLARSYVDEEKYGICVVQLKNALGLKGNGGLHVFLNSVMNPHIVDNNLVDLIGNVVRQITLDTIGLLTDRPKYHGFIASGMINNDTVFGEYCTPSFDISDHQYQAIVKFKFLNTSEAKFLQQIQWDHHNRLHADRKPLIMQNHKPDVLGRFLKTATDDQYLVDCYLGVPDDRNPPFLSEISVMLEDVPVFRHFDMTCQDSYGEQFDYFIYGDRTRTYLSHKISQKSDYVQIVDLIEKPADMPLSLIEQGVDVSIQNLPENPDTMTDRDLHIESRHQTINYVGYNGLINTTTIDFNGTRRYNERLKTLTQVKQPLNVGLIKERVDPEREQIPACRKINERAFVHPSRGRAKINSRDDPMEKSRRYIKSDTLKLKHASEERMNINSIKHRPTLLHSMGHITVHPISEQFVRDGFHGISGLSLPPIRTKNKKFP